MYGLTPFGGTGFGLWDAFNDFDKNFLRRQYADKQLQDRYPR